MSTHSQLDQRRSPTGFLGALAEVVGPRGVPLVASRRGRKPRVPVTQLLPALTWHVMQDTGTLAEHLFQLFREPLADSSWSDRRLRLPWEIFAELMRRALRPRATPRQHREAFWRGWRLVALDGTQFSLINTPQITDSFAKAVTRRGRAAFAKMTTAVLLEVGLHNPLAAAIGRRGESEWALAQRLLAQLPTGALLLGDRLYGVTAFARLAQATCRRVGSQFLLRASRTVKPRVIKRLADGTRLVGLPVRSPRNPNHVIEWLEVREIRVRVGRKGHRAHELRLWTSLLTPRTAPALELARVYASRWEHELYFREINDSCAGPQSCRVIRWKPARRRSPRLGQRRPCERTRPRRRWPHPGASGELRAGAECRPRHVAVLRTVRRCVHGPTEDPRHSPRARPHPPQRDRASPTTHVSAGRAPAGDALAAAHETRIDPSAVAASNPMIRRHRISERHWH